MKRLGFISDTHNKKASSWSIEPCDIIVHSGDFSFHGRDTEISQFFQDVKKAKKLSGAKDFCITLGNHEKLIEHNEPLFRQMCKDNDVHCLINDAATIQGIKFFGCSYQPFFCNWGYNVRDSSKLSEYYAQIPDDTEILVTHCPPKGILDYSPMCGSVGSQELLDRVRQLSNLRINSFGHIHHSRGSTKIGDTTFINAAILDDNYQLNDVDRRMIFVDYETNK